jgi:hypothetical protein
MIEHLKSVGARAQWLSRDLGQQWRRDPQTKNSLCSSVKTRMEMDLLNNSSSSCTSNPNTPKKKKICNCPD